MGKNGLCFFLRQNSEVVLLLRPFFFSNSKREQLSLPAMDLDALELEEDGFALPEQPLAQQPLLQREPLSEARATQQQEQERPAANGANINNKRRSIASNDDGDDAVVGRPSPTSSAFREPLAKRPSGRPSLSVTATPRAEQTTPSLFFAGSEAEKENDGELPPSLARPAPPPPPPPPRFDDNEESDADDDEPSDDDDDEEAIPGPAGILREALRRGLVLEDGSEATGRGAETATTTTTMTTTTTTAAAAALPLPSSSAPPSLALVPARRDPRFDEGSAWDAAARAHGGWRGRMPAITAAVGGASAAALCVSGAVASAGAAGERSPRLALLVEVLRPTATAASLTTNGSSSRMRQQQAPAGSDAAALLRDPTGAVAATVCGSLLLLSSSSSSSSSSSRFAALRAGDAVLIDGAPILRPGWGNGGPLLGPEAARAAAPVLVLTEESVLGVWGKKEKGNSKSGRAPRTQQRWAALPPCAPTAPAAQEKEMGVEEEEAPPQEQPREPEAAAAAAPPLPLPPPSAPPPPSTAPPATHDAVENLMEGLEDEEGALVACGLLSQAKGK